MQKVQRTICHSDRKSDSTTGGRSANRRDNKNPITSKSPVGESEKAFTPPVVPPVVPASVMPRENAPVIFSLPSQETSEVPITLDDPDLNRLFDSVNESAVASSVHASLSSIRSNIVEVPLSQQSSTLSASVHPTASLVARLWEERRLGGVVEIHMAGGGMIIPDWYDENGREALTVFSPHKPKTKA